MQIKSIFLLTFFIFGLLLSSSIFASVCNIETAKNIVYLDKNKSITANDVIISSDCPSEIQNNFTKTILNFSGQIRAQYLKTAFRDLFYPWNIKISPAVTYVHSLSSIIKSKLAQRKDRYWTDLSQLSKKNIFLLDDLEDLSINCHNCDITGHKNIELTINNFKEKKQHHSWIKGTLTTEAEGLVVQTDLGVTNKNIDPSRIKRQKVKAINPDQLFSDLKNLKFYKLNKPLVKGRAIKNSDLSAILIVRQGIPCKTIIKNNSLSISGMATPIRSGKIGDIIQLRNLKSNRIILGKVVDYNKVVVDI